MSNERNSEFWEKYELAKIYAMVRDMDNLKAVSSEINKLAWNCDKSGYYEERVAENKKVIDGYVKDYIDEKMPEAWDEALEGNGIACANRMNEITKCTNELNRTRAISREVMEYRYERGQETWEICRSNVYLRLLKNFNNACFEEDIAGIETSLEGIVRLLRIKTD